MFPEAGKIFLNFPQQHFFESLFRDKTRIQDPFVGGPFKNQLNFGNFSQLPSAGLQNYLLFQVENMPTARKEDMGPEIWKLSEISAPPGNVHLRRQGSLCVTYWYCLRHLKTLYFTNTEIHKYNLRPFTGGSWNLS